MSTKQSKVRCPRCRCFRIPEEFINKKQRKLKTCSHCRTHVKNSRIRKKAQEEKKKPVILPQELQTIIMRYACNLCQHCLWSADYLVSVNVEQPKPLCSLCTSIYVDVVSCLEIYNLEDELVEEEDYPHTYGSDRALPLFKKQTEKILCHLYPETVNECR